MQSAKNHLFIAPSLSFLLYFLTLKNMIKQLSQQTAEDLCAQQVITSLPDCIKELIDNSIDAKATFIRIMLHEYGKSKVEVVDNGMGIDSFDFLGKKGSTSKNKLNDKFDYLGFRGEAVHSIGRVSGAMEIQSKCSKDGYRRKFNVITLNLQEFKQERICSGDFNFQLPNRQGSKNTGTKVTIQRIFQKLPVRHIELQSKHKEFLRKTHEMIKQFCIIYPEIQFVFINSKQGKQEVLIETASHKRYDRTAWLDRIKELDERIGSNLTYINHSLFEGFVLGKIQSGSSKQNAYIKKNYHYLFANRRPIDILPSLLSTLNEIYKKYNNSTKYAFVINLKLDHQQIDVNLSPNKREIFVRKTVLENICENLKSQILQKVIEDIPTLNSYQEKQEKKGRMSQPSQVQSQIQNFGQNQMQSQMEPSVLGYGEKTVFSQPLQATTLPEPRIDGRNPRKSIYFPVKPSQNPPQENINDNNKPLNPFSKTQTFDSKAAPQSTQQKVVRTTKSSSFEDIQLPKIVVDRSKIKEQLNSKMGVSFSGIKRYTEPANKLSLTSLEDQGKQVDQRELDEIKKRNQLLKLRQEQEDAKKRAQFMLQLKEVKIEESMEHESKQSVYHSHLDQPQSETIPKKQREGKMTLMEQEVRRLGKNEGYNDKETEKGEQPSKIDAELKEEDEEGEEEFQPVSRPKKHDPELQTRIKSKLNVDMSQIFSNFNTKKQAQPNSQISQIDQPQAMVPSQAIDNGQIQDTKMDETLCLQLGDLAPKSLKKQQFEEFTILGQFNLGFIISHHRDRFYMVDQHAADQKYRFQKYLAKSKEPDCINCFEEREITPIQFDEIQEAKYLLQEAGFYYKIIDDSILKLERCPVFNEKKLGMEFFNQIVSEKRELQRLQRFSSICALMACRSAIKVGEPLTKDQMKREVCNLATLNSPWNCPHGRPTLIELGKIQTFKEGIRVQKQYFL